MSEEFSLSDEDKQIIHTLMEHMATAAEELWIAEEEMKQIEDERIKEFLEFLTATNLRLDELFGILMDQLPGFPSRAEREEYAERVKTMAHVLDIAMKRNLLREAGKDEDDPEDDLLSDQDFDDLLNQ